MLLNKPHYSIKCNNYLESLNIFESPTKSPDIFSQKILAGPHRQQKSKDELNNLLVVEIDTNTMRCKIT